MADQQFPSYRARYRQPGWIDPADGRERYWSLVTIIDDVDGSLQGAHVVTRNCTLHVEVAVNGITLAPMNIGSNVDLVARFNLGAQAPRLRVVTDPVEGDIQLFRHANGDPTFAITRVDFTPTAG